MIHCRLFFIILALSGFSASAVAKGKAATDSPADIFGQLLMQIAKDPTKADDTTLQGKFSQTFLQACIDSGRKAREKTWQEHSKNENQLAMELVKKQCTCVSSNQETVQAFSEMGRSLARANDGRAAYALFNATLAKVDNACMQQTMTPLKQADKQ